MNDTLTVLEMPQKTKAILRLPDAKTQKCSADLSWLCRALHPEPRKSLRLKDKLFGTAFGVVLRCDARIGQAHDAAFQTHEISFEINPLCTMEADVGVAAVPDNLCCSATGRQADASCATECFAAFVYGANCRLAPLSKLALKKIQ